MRMGNGGPLKTGIVENSVNNIKYSMLSTVHAYCESRIADLRECFNLKRTSFIHSFILSLTRNTTTGYRNL